MRTYTLVIVISNATCSSSQSDVHTPVYVTRRVVSMPCYVPELTFRPPLSISRAHSQSLYLGEVTPGWGVPCSGYNPKPSEAALNGDWDPTDPSLALRRPL